MKDVTDYETRKNLAANIDRLLATKGWSRYRLAQDTGETQMMLSRICNMTHTPNIGTVTRIAEALEVTVDELLAPTKRNSRSAISGIS